MNDLGTISRTNPAQHVEGALGKIAAKFGTKYSVPDFDKQAIPDFTAFAQQELARHGFDPSSTEPVYDPVKRRWIQNPLHGGHPQTGNRFILKLHHTAESKGGGRGTGGYTAEGTPAKGGATGSKRISLMDVNALLSHGNTEAIRDAGLYRGQADPDRWARFMAGHDVGEPKVPHVHAKFYALLKAAGLHPVKDGTKIHLMALTDKDVDELAGTREIQNAETVDFEKGMKPVRGGLFDPSLVGGAHGGRWAAMPLHEPMPNPAMEEPIRRILGLTEAGFRDVLAGREDLGGRTGPRALQTALSAVNVDAELAQAKADVKSGKAGQRDSAIRKWRFLDGAKKHGLHPRDWMLSRVPVLPPEFRPVSVMQGSKLPMVADANLLYQELHDANKNLAGMAGQVDDLSEEREAVYDSLKGVVGLGEPVHPKNQEKQVKGLLKHVFGTSPKFGMIQRKLLGSTVDLVGRAVITPDPDLDMDQVGVPENRAWDIYQPFVIRNLSRGGVPRIQAVQHAKARTELARKALLEEMDKRPVTVTRAPVLHRYGMMAFRPKLVPGDVLRVPPIVDKGYGADHDGDAVTYHVFASDDASQKALDTMLPSRNLFSTASFKGDTYVPNQEYVSGLYIASKARNDQKRPRVFATADDAFRAYQRGEMSVDHPVKIVQHD